MKILALTNLYPPHSVGGYEERCRRVLDLLRARGHQVRVLTSNHRVAGVATPGGPESHVIRRLRIHGFFGHPWLPPHRLFFLEKHNHDTLRAELAAFQPDVVHLWNMGGLSKGLLLTLKGWGGPVVYDVSDHWIARSLKADVWQRWWAGEAGGSAARILRAALRVSGLAGWILRAAPAGPWSDFTFEKIYFCSRALRDATSARGWPVSHAEIIYCGVETHLYKVREPSERFEELLFVGRLDPDKDPLTAIRALGVLHRRGAKSLRLTLYGRGPGDYTARLQSEARDLGVAHAVRFASAPSKEMPGVYARFDALIFTSAWEEPFALTPLEAMAAGLPVVGTPNGGSRELFRDGENALVFPAGDAERCAEAVERLASDASLRRCLVETALREVRARYDIGAVAAQIEDYLREAVRGHRRAA